MKCWCLMPNECMNERKVFGHPYSVFKMQDSTRPFSCWIACFVSIEAAITVVKILFLKHILAYIYINIHILYEVVNFSLYIKCVARLKHIVKLCMFKKIINIYKNEFVCLQLA